MADTIPSLCRVLSEGRPGVRLIADLSQAGCTISSAASAFIGGLQIDPVRTVYDLLIIRAAEFESPRHITKQVQFRAETQNAGIPPAEVAVLLRQLFTDTQMRDAGLKKLIVMHEPFIGPDGGLHWLSVERGEDGPLLRTRWAPSLARWRQEGAFVFLAPVDGPSANSDGSARRARGLQCRVSGQA